MVRIRSPEGHLGFQRIFPAVNSATYPHKGDLVRVTHLFWDPLTNSEWCYLDNKSIPIMTSDLEGLHHAVPI